MEAGRQAGGRSPPGRRTGTDGRQSTAAAARGRPEARKSDFPAGSPRRIRLFLSFSFSFFFFKDFKAFSGFFLSFSLFLLQAAEPESGGGSGDPGRREQEQEQEQEGDGEE